jgi:hypothetical protein
MKRKAYRKRLRKIARTFLYYRDVGVSPWTRLLLNLPRIAPLYVVIAAVAALLLYLDYQFAAVAVVGFWLGRAVRDLQYMLASSEWWLVMKYMLDWAKIERIASWNS